MASKREGLWDATSGMYMYACMVYASGVGLPPVLFALVQGVVNRISRSGCVTPLRLLRQREHCEEARDVDGVSELRASSRLAVVLVQASQEWTRSGT